MLYGISTIQPNYDCNKVLTLISNVIQKISNYCEYEPEHEFYCLNEYVRDNTENLNIFISKIIDDNPSQSDTSLMTLSDVRRDYEKLLSYIKSKEVKLTEIGEQDKSISNLLKENQKIEELIRESEKTYV